jgi:hypothetical protein
MTQPHPQQRRAQVPQATDRFAATVRGMRSIALSLLVDRAWSA